VRGRLRLRRLNRILTAKSSLITMLIIPNTNDSKGISSGRCKPATVADRMQKQGRGGSRIDF
jgi:hypothetical protein